MVFVWTHNSPFFCSVDKASIKKKRRKKRRKKRKEKERGKKRKKRKEKERKRNKGKEREREGKKGKEREREGKKGKERERKEKKGKERAKKKGGTKTFHKCHIFGWTHVHSCPLLQGNRKCDFGSAKFDTLPECLLLQGMKTWDRHVQGWFQLEKVSFEGE